MKNLTLMAIAMGMLAFTACTEKKPAAAPATQAEEVVTDSAFQQAVAGEYKSADGKRIITVNADFTVKTTGLDKDYFKCNNSAWSIRAFTYSKKSIHP